MNKPKTLYLSYTGLMEPLGKSQILGYLKRLSSDYAVTLVTFEKPSDYSDAQKVEELNALCNVYGITWLPQKYHSRPRLFATFWDICTLIYMTSRLSNGVKLIHCRNYIPAMCAWFVGLFTNIPFLFDMRALWIEELIEADSIKRGGAYHKLISWFEAKLLRKASQVVTLTKAVIPFLTELYPWLDRKKFTVIPTCVDLERFFLSSTKKQDFLTIGSMGTLVSGRYQLALMLNAFSSFEKKWPSARFKLITRDDHNKIRQVCEEVGFPPDKLLITTSTPDAIADKISDFDLAVVFFTPGLSTLGTSPTRIGEFLASGIPVVVNQGVGDTADIISSGKVGAVIVEHNFDALVADVRDLINDEDTKHRCRALSEKLLSTDVGADKYLSVYRNILNENC